MFQSSHSGCGPQATPGHNPGICWISVCPWNTEWYKQVCVLKNKNRSDKSSNTKKEVVGRTSKKSMISLALYILTLCAGYLNPDHWLSQCYTKSLNEGKKSDLEMAPCCWWLWSAIYFFRCPSEGTPWRCFPSQLRSWSSYFNVYFYITPYLCVFPKWMGCSSWWFYSSGTSFCFSQICLFKWVGLSGVHLPWLCVFPVFPYP